MHLVIFGLCISSSWGNGHATLWRGLVKALARRGHTITFYERDVPYYSATRDGWVPPRGVFVQLYEHWEDVREEAKNALGSADVGMTTSYCADGPAAASLVFESRVSIKAFYDMDTPVTLRSLETGSPVPYLPAQGLRDFDLVLSYTGGRALDELKSRLGARRVYPLYGWVDEETHVPADPVEDFRAELSYLGTYAADRQPALSELLVEPARRRPEARFAIGGTQYPDSFPWTPNIFFVRHLPPAFHPAFFCSSRLTLNVTRQAMVQYGYCPSGRLFEAAACGVPIVTDTWEGLSSFFEPEKEILLVHKANDILDALSLSDGELARIADAARARVLAFHTAERRAVELESVFDSVSSAPQVMQEVL